MYQYGTGTAAFVLQVPVVQNSDRLESIWPRIEFGRGSRIFSATERIHDTRGPRAALNCHLQTRICSNRIVCQLIRVLRVQIHPR